MLSSKMNKEVKMKPNKSNKAWKEAMRFLFYEKKDIAIPLWTAILLMIFYVFFDNTTLGKIACIAALIIAFVTWMRAIKWSFDRII